LEVIKYLAIGWILLFYSYWVLNYTYGVTQLVLLLMGLVAVGIMESRLWGGH